MTTSMESLLAFIKAAGVAMNSNRVSATDTESCRERENRIASV